MDRKESANGLQLIKFGAIRLRGNFSVLFMGALAMCMPLILALGVPAVLAILLGKGWVFSIGIVLFIILAGPLQVGYIKFFNATLDGKQPKISMVYSQFRFSVNTLKYIYFVGLLFIMYVFGFALWIIPAGFAISYYSMVLFFQEKFEYKRFSDAFNDCSRKMIRNRLAMFSYKLVFYFVYLMLFCVAGLSLGLIYVLSLESLLLTYICTICLMIIFIFLYTMVTVYFHSCNQIFFEDTLMYHERKAMEKKAKAEKKKAQEMQAKMCEAHIGDKVEDVAKEPKVEEVEIKEPLEQKVEVEAIKNEDAKKVATPKTPTTSTKATKSPSTKAKKTTTQKSTTTKKSTATKKASTTKKTSAKSTSKTTSGKTRSTTKSKKESEK